MMANTVVVKSINISMAPHQEDQFLLMNSNNRPFLIVKMLGTILRRSAPPPTSPPGLWSAPPPTSPPA